MNVNAGLTVFDTLTGQFSISVDAIGSNNSSHDVDVEKPAGATVLKAYVLSASFSGTIGNGDVTIDGTPITWAQTVINNIGSFTFTNVLADVTSIVKPTIDAAPAGTISFTFVETANNSGNDGEILVVIFNDATQPVRTISLLFGGQDSNGDNFAISLVDPIVPTDPNAMADFGLGISFGFQGTGQFSTVDVNGTRITSSAGGQDDGFGGNGALITVGGLGDSNANPANPNAGPGGDPRTDDELYSLLPILSGTETSIDVFTENPSDDDNIFFAYFFLSGAAIVGEGIILGPLDAINMVGTEHTVIATVVDGNGEPVSGVVVSFEIISGPHVGMTGNATTNANGKASFTYTGTTTGLDVIKASQGALESNTVTKRWEPSGPTLAEVISVTATPVENGIQINLICFFFTTPG